MSDGATISQDFGVKYNTTITCLAVDCTGGYACLGGKRGLYLVDVAEPWDGPFKTLYQRGKWPVGRVQWHPARSMSSYIASSANTNVRVWNVGDARFALQANFRAHTRPVLDFSWSPHNPNVLGTASADPTVTLWDVRTHATPSLHLSINVKAPTASIKFNRKNEHLLATASEGVVKVWDLRKIGSAVSMITAHMTKIIGLDWHPTKELDLLTCGLDKRVKWWDMNNPKSSKGRILSSVSFSHAQFTPFGDGVITAVARPHSLCVWSLENLSAPVHTWENKQAAEAIAWRVVDDGSLVSYQLISWHRGKELRFWKVDPETIEACGDTQSVEEKRSQRRLSAKVIRDPVSAQTASEFEPEMGLTLAQEFSFIRVHPIIGITMTSEDAFHRTCTASIENDGSVLYVRATFPQMYPYGAPPSWDLLPSSTVSTAQRQQLKLIVSDRADSLVSSSTPCIVACLVALSLSLLTSTLYTLDKDIEDEDNNKEAAYIKEQEELRASPLKPPTRSRLLQSSGGGSGGLIRSLSPFSAAALSEVEKNMPCPAISGACFSPDGRLVTFQAYTTRPTTTATSNRSGPSRTLSHSRGGAIDSPSSFPPLRTYADLKDLSAHMERRREKAAKESSTAARQLQVSKLYFYDEEVDLLPINLRLGSGNGAEASSSSPSAPGAGAHAAKGCANLVRIHDISCLMPVSRELAGRYQLNAARRTVPELCSANASIAKEMGRHDLVRVWRLLEHVSRAALYPATLAHRVSRAATTVASGGGGGGGYPNAHQHHQEDAGAFPPSMSASTGHHASGGGALDVSGASSGVGAAGGLLEFASRAFAATVVPRAPKGSGAGKVGPLAGMMRPAEAPRGLMPRPGSSTPPWSFHPFGRTLVHSMLEHHLRLRDVQTVAMIVYITRMVDQRWYHAVDTQSSSGLGGVGGVASTPLLPSSTGGAGTYASKSQDKARDRPGKLLLATMGRAMARKREKGTDATKQHSMSESVLQRAIPSSFKDHAQDHSLAMPGRVRLYEFVCSRYAELLYRWGELNARALVLKGHDNPKHSGVVPAVICWNCKHGLKKRVYCHSCKQMAFKCIICHLPVKGLSSFCLACGHGGHTKHMREWFSKHDFCPTGCGCRCSSKNLMMWGDPLKAS